MLIIITEFLLRARGCHDLELTKTSSTKITNAFSSLWHKRLYIHLLWLLELNKVVERKKRSNWILCLSLYFFVVRERCDSRGNKAATHSSRSHNPHRDVTTLSTNHTAPILSFSFFFFRLSPLYPLLSSYGSERPIFALRINTLMRDLAWPTNTEGKSLSGEIECRVNNQTRARFDITTTSSIRRPILSGAVVGAAQQMPAYPATTTVIGYH